MFRCVEAVYRANRAFGVVSLCAVVGQCVPGSLGIVSWLTQSQRLKDIGSNPSDPKALGDLLMRWVRFIAHCHIQPLLTLQIDDLEPSYGRYATIFLTGFDNYPPVSSNTLLPGILNEVSMSSPPTPPLQQWSLDALFLLPYNRLRYYRKLYSRLLQNTVEGRSDHRLLATGVQRIEALVADVEARLECDVSEEDTPVPSSAGGDSQSRETSWPNEKSAASRASSGVDSSVESQSV